MKGQGLSRPSDARAELPFVVKSYKPENRDVLLGYFTVQYGALTIKEFRHLKGPNGTSQFGLPEPWFNGIRDSSYDPFVNVKRPFLDQMNTHFQNYLTTNKHLQQKESNSKCIPTK
jgi:hypothetical protein